MDGKDQEVYSRALFRNINYLQLKSELVSRNTNFSPSDTYYLLTLKLRRGILQKYEGNEVLVKKIDEEIAEQDTSKHSVANRYRCSLPGCPFISKNHKKYLSHLEFVHQNTKSRLMCQFRHSCTREFPSVSMLKSHVKTAHSKQLSSVQLRQSQLVEDITSLKCVESSCNHQTVSNIKSLKIHLYSHTGKREETGCIFCSYRTDATGSLSSHLSRKHKIQTVELLNEGIVHVSDAGDVACDAIASNSTQGSANLDNVSDSEEEDDLEDNSEITTDDLDGLFVKALAITVNIQWKEITLFFSSFFIFSSTLG